MDEARLDEEMALLAKISIQTARFLSYMLQSLAFFIYGLGALGGALLGAGIGRVSGHDPTLLASIGSWAGIILATISMVSLPRPPRSKARRVALIGVFFASILASMIVVWLLAPQSIEVSWVPGLGLALVGWYLLEPEPPARTLLYSGVALLLFSPVAVILGSWELAAGYTALVYMVVGVAAARAALSRLPR